jgi:hypothetical protein
MYDLSGYIWAAVLVGVIGMPAATSVALYRGAIRAGLGRRRAAGVAAAAATLLAGWLVATSLIARDGAYNHSWPVPLLALVAGAVLIALLAATRIPIVSRVLAAPDTVVWLTVLQTFRIVGAASLAAAAVSPLSLLFAVPAGLGDTATGVAAPFVARRLARGNGRRATIWFNVFGLADLVVAVIAATLARRLMGDQSIEPLRLLPLVLVPTFGVPLAMAMHIISLGRLLPRRARAREAALQAQA